VKPAAQRQLDKEVAPAELVLFPGQDVHDAVLLIELLYVPATQAAQLPSNCETYPALQRHIELSVLPLLLVENEGQLKQDEEPPTLLYVFTGQAAHPSPSGPVDPGGQIQLVRFELCAALVDPPGQAVHSG
jgi:hypothetical protein